MMEKIKFGGAGEIPPVEEKCEGDVFENAIRRIGVIAACEWFGHRSDSEFTQTSLFVLLERHNPPHTP